MDKSGTHLFKSIQFYYFVSIKESNNSYKPILKYFETQSCMQTYRQYSFTLQKSLFYPIKVALFERSISVPTLVKELNAKPLGIKYTLHGLENCFKGINTASISLHYYSNIYIHLSLPLPTIEYLHYSFQRWEEIKALKLDVRNTNRIKRGLLPVNSLSRRIK